MWLPSRWNFGLQRQGRDKDPDQSLKKGATELGLLLSKENRLDTHLSWELFASDMSIL